MDIACVWEHNGNDTILYSETCTGAYTRGENRNAALEKMAAEVRSYYAWLGKPAPENLCPVIVQEKKIQPEDSGRGQRCAVFLRGRASYLGSVYRTESTGIEVSSGLSEALR